MYPAFLDESRRYSRITLTRETDNGAEVARFAVLNPQAWEQPLRTFVAKSKN